VSDRKVKKEKKGLPKFVLSFSSKVHATWSGDSFAASKTLAWLHHGFWPHISHHSNPPSSTNHFLNSMGKKNFE